MANTLLFIIVWIFSLSPLALDQRRVKEELKAQRVPSIQAVLPRVRLRDVKSDPRNSFKLYSVMEIPVPFSTIQKGQYSGVLEPSQIVIRTQNQWDNLWKRHSSRKVNPPPPPFVDFENDMVVGVFLGEKRTGGYEVKITSAKRSNSNLYLYYREKSPPRDVMVTQALTQPYHLVKVSKFDIPPIFLRESP